MISNVNEDYSIKTQASHDTVETDMMKQKNKRQRVKTLLVVTLCFLISILLLYFILPMYQCKNIKVNGNIFFENKEVAVLSENDTYRPLIFLNEKRSKEKLIENSHGFILDAQYSTNGFASSVIIKEDHLVGNIDGVKYLGSDRNFNQALEDISFLPLDETNIYTLKEKLEKQALSVPKIFIKDVDKMSDTQRKRVLFHSWQATLPVLEKTYAIRYSSEDAKVADFLFLYHGSYYLLKNLLYDKFPYYFDEKNFPDKIFNAMEMEQKENKRPKRTYAVSTTQSESCYSYTLIYNEAENTTKLTYFDEEI